MFEMLVKPVCFLVRDIEYCLLLCLDRIHKSTRKESSKAKSSRTEKETSNRADVSCTLERVDTPFVQGGMVREQTEAAYVARAQRGTI